MNEKPKGLCEPNKKGILELNKLYPNQVTIKRFANSIMNNGCSKIQFGNALNLNRTLNIPLEKIIKL